MRKVIMSITAALFLGWSLPAKIVDRIVAQVNDDIITLSDLNREMTEIRQEVAQKFSGQQLEEELKKAEKEVLDELIRQKLLLQKGNELGFGANVDVQVTALLERIRKENNLKDMQDLERAAAQQGLTMANLRERFRRQIITNGVVQEFVGGRITILTQEIEKYYREHSPEYTLPEEVALSEILIPGEGDAAAAEARANDLIKRLKQGEPFATLASQFSKGPTAGKGGSIGTYQTAKLAPSIANPISNLKEGEITPVQKLGDGFIIFRVDSRKPARMRPLEEMREDIRNRLYQMKFAPEFERFIAQLKEDAYIQIFPETK
jgi:peptidyl-prolyl cis-trans isomerase SurA